MPLSTPHKRRLTHTRVVTCTGYKREDGLLDIEGHLIDTKPFDFPNKDRGGLIRAGEALHGMHIRLTIDLEMNIKDAEAVIDDSPYNYCKSVTSVFDELVGLKIGPGWRKRIHAIMGHTKGCTHLTELLGPMATTAFQTIVSERSKLEERGAGAVKDRDHVAPNFLNTCHSHASTSPVVKEHWPEYYDGPKQNRA